MLDYSSRTNMGLDLGLESPNFCPKRKFRWLFMVDGVCGVANTLPPLKSARPQLEFKEQMVAHTVEDIYIPVRPEWKPIQLTLYDIDTGSNPVFDWISSIYDVQSGIWRGLMGNNNGANDLLMRPAALVQYDGCGNVLETWQFDNAYPQSVNWGDLDMGDSSIVTVDITLRYQRSYIYRPDQNGTLS